MKEVEVKKKFYTALVLWMADSVSHKITQFHCTHKFLGSQPPERMREVFKICDEYFKEPKKFPLAIFNKEAMFGKKEDERVLLSHISNENFFLDLRGQLDPFRNEDYSNYQPHITVEHYPEINGHFQAYAIMTGEQILAYWRNPIW